MSKADKFIKDNIRYSSNAYWDKHDGDSYFPWLTQDQARRVAEIAREETIKEVCEWIKCNVDKYSWYDPIEDNEGFNVSGLIDDLKKHFEGKL